MRQTTGPLRCIVLLCLSALLLAACGDAAGTGSVPPPAPSCPGIAGRPSSAAVDGRWTPVVFIHGFASNRAIFDAPLPDLQVSIVQQVAAVPGAAAYTFDYSAASLQWVDDPAQAPAFAGALECLARFHHHRAVVVAHSMGGLVTRAAAARPDPAGGTARDSIAAVMTLGTPFLGSELAEQDRHLGAVVSALCQTALRQRLAFPDLACALTAEPVRHSPALAALEPGSAQLAALPPWPAGLPVLPFAGNLVVSGPIGGSPVLNLGIGDSVVSVPSATATGTGGGPPVVDTCPMAVAGAASIAALLQSRCFHTNLPANPLAAATAVRLVTSGAGLGAAQLETT